MTRFFQINIFLILKFNQVYEYSQTVEKQFSRDDSEEFVVLKIPLVGSASFEFSKKWGKP